jgi:cob(I)alamin adenosyltransferase
MAKAKAASKKPQKRTVKKAAAGGETNLIRRVTMKKANAAISAFGPGDSVNVFVKVVKYPFKIWI